VPCEPRSLMATIEYSPCSAYSAYSAYSLFPVNIIVEQYGHMELWPYTPQFQSWGNSALAWSEEEREGSEGSSVYDP
jgi:hypothetical protein